MDNILKFKPTKELTIIIGILALCWIFNFIADQFRGSNWFYFFYQGLFALGICITLPLWFTAIKMKRPLSTIGIKTSNWKIAVIIGLVISSLAFIGRMMGMNIEILNKSHFIYILICMTFSTLFEEIFFRGFLQSRFENFFGIIPSILLSSICFALYHSAQSFIGLDFHQLITLFCVGIVFGISYRLAQNIMTSFLVNFPQAVLTFIGEKKYIEYSQNINILSAVISSIVIIVAIYIIIKINAVYSHSQKRHTEVGSGS